MGHQRKVIEQADQRTDRKHAEDQKQWNLGIEIYSWQQNQNPQAPNQGTREGSGWQKQKYQRLEIAIWRTCQQVRGTI